MSNPTSSKNTVSQNKDDYFLIEKKHLRAQKFFPFQLFMFNPVLENFSLILGANRPLSKDLEMFLNSLIIRGGSLAILMKQKKTFLNSMEHLESEIPSLKEPTTALSSLGQKNELDVEQGKHQDILQKWIIENGEFNFRDIFTKSVNNNSFLTIIQYTRLEVNSFSRFTSPQVSLAIQLCDEFLTLDNEVTRVVAISYQFAKTFEIHDEEFLCDIVLGAFFTFISSCHFPLEMFQKNREQFTTKEENLYKKHPLIAHHLLKKSGIQITERIKFIVLEHHERINGSGFPMEKAGDAIEFASQIVGVISHLFEYCSGKITGQRESIKSTIFHLKNRSIKSGLEYHFSDTIINNLANLINHELYKSEFEDNALEKSVG